MKIASNRISDIVRFFRDELKGIIEEQELEIIISWCFEAFLGLSRAQLMLKMNETVSESELLKFNFAVKDLKKHRPIQYILGEADFFRMKFFVDENVLIPRPETEELADHIIKENSSKEKLSILDIGTGSGCIAITLAKHLPQANVSGMDISEKALEIANRNADRNSVKVNFIKSDILSGQPDHTVRYNIIVSNPPYIRFSEKEEMKKNVLDHEPHLALFVMNEDPLLFYRAIADHALNSLLPGGTLWFELNSSLGPETQSLLVNKGFKNVTLIKDLSKNNRILRVIFNKEYEHETRFIIVFSMADVFSRFCQDGFSVEVFPTNIGGKEEFKRVFEQEMVYPEKALKNGYYEKVTLNFDVNKDSTVSNIKLQMHGDKEIDAEAIRVFRLLKWVPAIREGQYVSASWSVTFDFDPKKYTKLVKRRGYDKIKYLENEKVDTSMKVYTSNIQLPVYEKGNFALQDFIKENLEYPRQAQVSNIQGTVLLSFVVEPSGMMTNIGIEKSVGGGCDQEAIRVLQMIKWYPGKHNDQLARVRMTFPFYFILNEDFKDNSAGEQK